MDSAVRGGGVLGTGFGWVLAYGNCDATYSGELLGYWSDQCALKNYPPHLEESRVDLLARHKATDYVSDHVSRVPIVVAARVGRVWDVFRPTQNVRLNQFFERRGRVQLVQRFGLYRTFQVQMQLGFGQFQQEIGHT